MDNVTYQAHQSEREVHRIDLGSQRASVALLANGSIKMSAGGHVRIAPIDIWMDADAKIAALESELAALRKDVAPVQAELDALKRGEYICRKCGLRKDS